MFRCLRIIFICCVFFLTDNLKIALAEENQKSDESPKTNEEPHKDDGSNENTSKRSMVKTWVAYILRQKKTGRTIPFLEFKSLQVPIVLVPKNGGLIPMIDIKGSLRIQGWKMEIDQEMMILDYGGHREFSIPLYITGRLNIFKLKAINRQNETIEENLFIFAPQSDEFVRMSPWNSVMAFLGLSGFGYYQSNYGVYKAIVSLLSVRYSPMEGENPLSWAAQVDMTMQTLYSTPIKRGPQLVESNLSVSYRLDSHYDPRLSEQVLLGGKYLTMISNDSPFGFSNLLSPEFGWRVRWKEDNANYFGGELKLTALGTNLLKNRGFGLGWSWNRSLKNGHNFELGINYSGFMYQADPQIEVRTDLLSIKLGYSL